MNEPPADADVLIYHHGPNVALEPRNLAAKTFLDTTLGDDVLAGYGKATIIEEWRVISLVDKLIVAGFNVVGQKSLVEPARSRLYVCDGRWGHYNTRGSIPPKVVDLILKGAGAPN